MRMGKMNHSFLNEKYEFSLSVNSNRFLMSFSPKFFPILLHLLYQFPGWDEFMENKIEWIREFMYIEI